MNKLPEIVINGTKVTLNETGGESRGGKKLATAEVQFPNGDKLYIKAYLGQNGPVRDAAGDVEVFDSKKGKVTREKAKGEAKAEASRMDKLEAMLAALLAQGHKA